MMGLLIGLILFLNTPRSLLNGSFAMARILPGWPGHLPCTLPEGPSALMEIKLADPLWGVEEDFLNCMCKIEEFERLLFRTLMNLEPILIVEIDLAACETIEHDNREVSTADPSIKNFKDALLHYPTKNNENSKLKSEGTIAPQLLPIPQKHIHIDENRMPKICFPDSKMQQFSQDL